MDIRWRLISIASVPGVPLESTSASTRASTRCALWARVRVRVRVKAVRVRVRVRVRVKAV